MIFDEQTDKQIKLLNEKILTLKQKIWVLEDERKSIVQQFMKEKEE